jgi:hypothetical protein
MKAKPIMYQNVIEEMALSVSLALMKENLKSKRISGSNENRSQWRIEL